MTQRPDFFDLNDIALMARVAQKPYDPKSDSDIASGNEIKEVSGTKRFTGIMKY